MKKAVFSQNAGMNLTTPSLKFFKPTLATTLAIVLAWLLSVRSAQAGYVVTLRQVGPNVVATGRGAINLTGLTFSQSSPPQNAGILPRAGAEAGGAILTGPTSSSVDYYFEPRGPMSFGSGGLTRASSGSGDMVGIFGGVLGTGVLAVPRGYVSGTALSDMAIYSGKTIATLGARPGTYVWTWGSGANQNFTLKILPGPIITTNPAAFIASFSATLKGSLNPDGLSTTFHFQYGTTTSYGLTTAPETQTGDTSRPVSANINSLTASTTYHFRIVASNADGTRMGSDKTFITLSPTGFPIVTTKPATNVATSSATLNGLLDPHGLSTSVNFQYGTTTSYGSTTATQTQTGNTYRNISANISGLMANRTYHFRIKATNMLGTRFGSDRTFSTP